MSRFLSAEWIAAMDRAASASSELASAAGDTEPLIIQHTVSDIPGRDTVTFHLAIHDGSVSVRKGAASNPTVTFTQTYATAADIAAGHRSAQAAFMAGELQIGGQVDRLIAHHVALAGIGDLFAQVRSDTSY